MLDAYEYQCLRKVAVQVQSIAAYDDNLLVGTKAGHLLMFNLSSRVGESKREVQLLRYNKAFSKKPILQLSVVPEHDILISLSDSVISVHNLSNNFDLIKTFQQTKGASVFTLDIQKPKSLTGGTAVTVRLCVAVKKKLQFYYWKNSEFLKLTDDITLHDTPKVLSWSEEAVCLGFKDKYRLVFLSGVHQSEGSNQKELFPTGKQPEPSVIKMSDTTFVIGKENQSTFINNKGDPALISMLKWPEIPIAMVYDDPYLIAVLRDTVMVQTVDPMLEIQTLPIKDGHVICRCKQGVIYVATFEHVYCISSVPREHQIRILLEQKQFQLALKLTNTSDNIEEDKKKNIHRIQTLYAFDLFRNKRFLESMKQFIDLETDPYEVIQLFPNLLPQQVRGQMSSVDSSAVKLEDKDYEDGLMALIQYLTMVRQKLMSKEKEDSKSKKYQQLLQIIDTTLLKCYLQTNDALVAPLLRRKNCHLEETERTLKKYHKYNELVILYQTRDLHKEALELLQKQADQPDSSLRGLESTIQYLQALGKEHINLIFQFAGWVLEKHPEEGLKIFTEDLPEVEQLPRPRVLDYLLKTQKSLVIQYLEHVIHVWKETNSIFHNVLVHQYREKVQQLCNDNGQAEQQQGNNLRTKLLQLLEKSEHYVPEAVLIHFPFDMMYEERAIILEKLGRHEQALSIYVTVMNNVELAIQYCDRVYNKGCDQVYVLLIKLLISPPENWLGGVTAPTTAKPDLELALILLEDYADRLPPMKALKELPDTVELQRIQKFLTTSLQKQLNHRRRTQVLKGLLYAEHLQVQELRMHYESKSVVMTELNVCPVCKKKFGNQSAFVRYPNGDILHYSCRFVKDQENSFDK
ncbi:vacuolar protein sorting 39 [Lycorma delicatula]|uniref:vacuolar protein sorting 39 n=1 Tax=Lycorma delicatula TaxID=130591 RepID=UPI003F519B9B